MNRDEMLARLERHTGPWDLAVIGGGATGAGVAVDAASRGYTVVLLEQADFGKGTSSRSTKLVHGGVRYLRQGNISLVREALRERAILLRNAPHVVSVLPLVVPAYAQWERLFYGAGLTAYDLLSGRSAFGRSAVLSRRETLVRLPELQPDGLRGGVLYYDGQFDDARLLINLLQTAAEHGAVVLNYAPVNGLSTTAGRVDGVVARDNESGRELRVAARAVINATGAFADGIRALVAPTPEPTIAPSQGAHIVLDRSFLPGPSALMVPRVGDGRVMFALPWRRHTLVGTTDTPVASPSLEPRPLREEVEFLLNTAGRYLRRAPRPDDVLSVFAGIRPLIRRGRAALTPGLARDHAIDVEPSGLITTTGGKWTTYRHMAEQTVDRAAALAGLPARRCITTGLRVHGFDAGGDRHPLRAGYGADAPALARMAQVSPELDARLDPDLPCTAAEVVWAARHEMARTVEDVLARRSGALFLNARAAVRMAPAVAWLLARELRMDGGWERLQIEQFNLLAARYTLDAAE